MGEEDLERAEHAVRESGLERAVVLACHAVVGAVAGVTLVELFAGGEDDGGVGFFEEEEADDGVDGADDGEDPEDPAPAEILDYETSEEGTQGWTEERTE